MIRWFEKHNKLSWMITILGVILIFYFSSLSFGVIGGGIEEIYAKSWTSIVYHIAAFFFLSMFLFISLMQGRKDFRLFFLGVLSLIAYGILDEIHQFFVVGRFCTISDVGFDIIGILLASMLYFILLEYRKFKSRSLF